MVYGVTCFFSLSLTTINKIRYNLTYIIPISVKYLFQTAEIQDGGLELQGRPFRSVFQLMCCISIFKHSFIRYSCFTVVQ